MKATVRQMAEHVDALLARHGIVVEWREAGAKGTAYPTKRLVKISPVKTAISYAVALHEIGHVQTWKRRHSRLASEIAAWGWARENALCWTAVMNRCQERCMGSYMGWAATKLNRGVNIVVPATLAPEVARLRATKAMIGSAY